MSILVLTADDVRRALPMAAAIEAMREGFLALATGRATLPQRTAVKLADRDALSLFMPARVGEALGAKIVSVFPGNVERGLPLIHGIVVLIDAETGRPTALLDGASLTAIRTGAASGLATDLLAAPEASRVAVIGAGVQARTQLEAVCCVRRVKTVKVYSRTKQSAERFADEMAGSGDVPSSIDVVGSAADAASGADVICVATTSSEAVLGAEDVSDGQHINAVGSFSRAMIELDPQLVARCHVVVDQREAALEEAGEVIAAVDAGLVGEGDLVELGDVVAGKARGFGVDERPSMFKSVGLAIQDMAAAASALERARGEGLGQEVQL